MNLVNGIDFLPVEKRIKYVPPVEDINKVIAVAEPEDQDYLWTIRETMGRISEINRLAWDDVDFKSRHVVLYTRKKRGGHLTPRKIPMTLKLYEVLYRRYTARDTTKSWVFWHRYWNPKEQQWNEGLYKDRKRLMKTLCNKAGVRYFRYHALRHAGASLMENCNISIGVIQKVLGHESRTTTEIYLHNLGGIEREAMAIYEHARQSHTESHM